MSQSSEIYLACLSGLWVAFEAFYIYSIIIIKAVYVSCYLKPRQTSSSKRRFYLLESKEHNAQARKHILEEGKLLGCEQASRSRKAGKSSFHLVATESES